MLGGCKWHSLTSVPTPLSTVLSLPPVMSTSIFNYFHLVCPYTFIDVSVEALLHFSNVPDFTS